MTNTQPVEFLPGDRVLLEGGRTGTFLELSPELPGISRIQLDALTSYSVVPNGTFAHQPITAGCWVRVTGRFPREINTDKIGDVFKVEKIDGDLAYHKPKGFQVSASWHLKHLVRIADPEPAPFRMRMTAPAHPDLIAGEYLPGDRVFTTTAKPDYFGTIVDKKDPHNRVPVQWDDQQTRPQTVSLWTLDSVKQFFRREPVKPGSFVRLHQPKLGDYRYIGRVDTIEDIHGPNPIAIVAGGGYFVSSLVTVAELKKSCFNVWTGADGMTWCTVEAENFEISSAPETIALADTLTERLFIWSRVGSGSVEHCRDAELASQAIEEAAKFIRSAGETGLVDTQPATAWLTKYAPEKLPKPPVFKRGDLVDVDQSPDMVPATGRIISADHLQPYVEVITKFGDFITTATGSIKHSTRGH